MKRIKRLGIISVIVILILSVIFGIILNNLSDANSSLEQEKQSEQNNLNNILYNLQDTNYQITTIEDESSKLNTQLQVVSSDLKKLQSGTKYILHDPRYWDARDFLYVDLTDRKLYNEQTFNCADFSATVINNADTKGIRCGLVSINLSGGVGHACVVFNTTDRGLIYYEPQYDYQVNLQIGKDYWTDCVVCPSGYYFTRDPANVVTGFTIYW